MKDKATRVAPAESWPMDNVVYIQDFHRQRALENLRRITGLSFDSYPPSMAGKPSQPDISE